MSVSLAIVFIGALAVPIVVATVAVYRQQKTEDAKLRKRATERLGKLGDRR